MSTEKTACPACGQGWVRHVRVSSLKCEVFVCEECETTWLHRIDIGKHNPLNFVGFMRSRGLKGLWTEVEEM